MSAEELDDDPPEGIDDARQPTEDELRRREAALERILQFGDPVLRSRASTVTEFDRSLEEETEEMIEIMRDAMGVGLAATQLGRLRRVLVYQLGAEAEPVVLVNPRIEESSSESETAIEGCLSLPDIAVEVERPFSVRVSAQDVRGEPLEVVASDHEARVISHEVDHLEGVLMIDRAEREQRRGALRALREGEAYHPPEAAEEEGSGEPRTASAERA